MMPVRKFSLSLRGSDLIFSDASKVILTFTMDPASPSSRTKVSHSQRTEHIKPQPDESGFLLVYNTFPEL